jgi:hypothetical protein
LDVAREAVEDDWAAVGGSANAREKTVLGNLARQGVVVCFIPERSR